MEREFLVKQKMPTGGYFLLDVAKTFATQEKMPTDWGVYADLTKELS